MRNPAAQGRRDANHREICDAYAELHCDILDLSSIGKGCPDIAIAASGRMELVEIKTEDGELNEAQKRFARAWRGPKIVIARTRDDVEKHVRALRYKVATGEILRE